jgi:hypothetical protein
MGGSRKIHRRRQLKRLQWFKAVQPSLQIGFEADWSINLAVSIVGAVDGLKGDKWEREGAEVASVPLQPPLGVDAVLKFVRSTVEF